MPAIAMKEHPSKENVETSPILMDRRHTSSRGLAEQRQHLGFITLAAPLPKGPPTTTAGLCRSPGGNDNEQPLPRAIPLDLTTVEFARRERLLCRGPFPRKRSKAKHTDAAPNSRRTRPIASRQPPAPRARRADRDEAVV